MSESREASYITTIQTNNMSDSEDKKLLRDIVVFELSQYLEDWARQFVFPMVCVFKY
jgi:hypothetical protein